MDAKTAIYKFCNYQERSQQEVRDKLYELGAYSVDVNNLIAELIQSGLVNEERFAKAFVRGKFRMKQWGRVRILYQLKNHRISEYLQRKALKEIDPNEYFATALKLAERKLETLLSEKNDFIRRSKIFRYLQQKGYESSIISEILNIVLKG